MRASFWFNSMMATALVLGLGQASCGSDDDGPSCSSVCDKVVECYPDENKAECLSDCASMKDVLRSESFSALGQCMLDTSCAQLDQDYEETCFDEIMAAAPTSAAVPVIEAMCETYIECDAMGTGVTVEDCVSLMRGSEDLFELFGIFKDSVLDCLTSCFADATCDQLDGLEEDCFVQCGVTMVGSSDAEAKPSGNM